MNYSKFFAVTVISMSMMSPVLVSHAWAEKPGHAGKSQMHRSQKGGDQGDKVTIRIGSSDRDIIRSYLKTNYGKNCPPGLAKKNNGCLPPGQAKKYGIGGKLPAGYGSLPAALAAALGVPPRGTFYATVDKDVLLVSESTKLILDAVTLMSVVQ